MKDKKVNVRELLEEVSPPDVILPKSRSILRRRLMTSSGYRKQPVLFFKYLMGSIPVFAALLLFIIIKPGEMSAMKRLEKLENTYRNSFTANRVHYIKIKSSERIDNIGRPVIQQWRYGNDKVRILLQNQENNKILGHLIIKDEQIYYYNDPTSEVQLFVKQKHVNKETEPKAGKEVKKESWKAEKYKTMVLPYKESETLPSESQTGEACDKYVVIISRDSFDIFGFATNDPAKILNRLKSSPKVTYSGSSTRGGRTLENFEIHSSSEMRAFLLEPLTEEAKNDQSLLEQVISKLSIHKIDLNINNVFKSLDSRFRIQAMDVVETTSVDKHSGKIQSITHRVYESKSGERKNREIAIHRFTFLKEEFLSYEAHLFDQHLFRLEPMEKIEIRN